MGAWATAAYDQAYAWLRQVCEDEGIVPSSSSRLSDAELEKAVRASGKDNALTALESFLGTCQACENEEADEARAYLRACR